MGKLIISRRRGKGSPTYRAKGIEKIRLPIKTGKAHIIDLVHISARNTPIAKIKFEDGTVSKIIAPSGISTNSVIYFNTDKKIHVGNVMPIGKIPEGTPVFCIESVYGDGGKFCKSSGAFAIIRAHEGEYTYLKFPSKKIRKFKNNCRAIIGKPAGSGRVLKPFVKAGNKYKYMKSRGKLYPRTSPSKMNPTDHPFGGKTGPGRSTCTPKNAPPGQKVGNIGARRTGRRKR
ncbi:MAG: 50S ribosomal protein L2 [Candidatus Aenigmarchaeota archaeon ex4484_56]|nr:MAG: 50S ribosomal protein L2 [Candidatus Aenigmarchaeota archaeon ex4484_56]